jgi:SAM-dependent methyltransferase
LRQVLDYCARWMTKLTRGRTISPNTSIVKVNLGSGLTVAPGWINLDSSLNAFFANWPAPVLRQVYKWSGSRRLYSERQYVSLMTGNRFVHHDLTYNVPFRSKSVDFIYSSHFIEHVPRESAIIMLNECYRALKAGGRLRLCVPDLSYAISLYQRGQKEEALELFFVPSDDGYYSRHHYLYDFDMLKEILTSIGFTRVERCEYQKGHVPDVELLDNRPEQTLFLEAVK